MDPVLEELPKWSLLGSILDEIEDEIMRQEALTGLRPVRESEKFVCRSQFLTNFSVTWNQYCADNDFIHAEFELAAGIFVYS